MPKTPLLFTAAQRSLLLANAARSRQVQDNDGKFDPMPVVKWFLPEGAATWLITEIDPQDLDMAFGLCDLGLGEPELGSVSISEVQALRTSRFRLPVERDLHFTPKWTLSEYAAKARAAGGISRIGDR